MSLKARKESRVSTSRREYSARYCSRLHVENAKSTRAQDFGFPSIQPPWQPVFCVSHRIHVETKRNAEPSAGRHATEEISVSDKIDSETERIGAVPGQGLRSEPQKSKHYKNKMGFRKESKNHKAKQRTNHIGAWTCRKNCSILRMHCPHQRSTWRSRLPSQRNNASLQPGVPPPVGCGGSRTLGPLRRTNAMIPCLKPLPIPFPVPFWRPHCHHRFATNTKKSAQ